MRFMLLGFVLAVGLAMASDTVCDNPHCVFEWLGARGVDGIGVEAFERMLLSSPVLPATHERYFPEECERLRKLNAMLFRMENGILHGGAFTDFVDGLLPLLDSETAVSPRGMTENWFRRRTAWFASQLKEKVEYSLCRLLLDSNGLSSDPAEVAAFVWRCGLSQDDDNRFGQSVSTFANMLVLASEISAYVRQHAVCPDSLASEGMNCGRYRKCAHGRDIEYACRAGVWVLRCRCDSFGDMVGFDEYIPMIGSGRKCLDLCLSPTFNVKRAVLFSGGNLNPDDARISGTVRHPLVRNHVHGIVFDNVNAGAMRHISEKMLGK